jgi:sterol desaturase/sphingolipid hydroxylase (fatty acid hydroxylase superfamily)
MRNWFLLQGAIVGVAVVAIVWRETRRPLRRRVEPRLAHTIRNAAVGAVGAAAVHLVETPIVLPAAILIEDRGIGILHNLPLPRGLSVVLACVLMDYTLYVWHVLAHKRPWLWRFHVVHHADLDLDASTAVRFHFGELIISIPWRLAQIAVIGTGPRALIIWQTATLVSILFHHSNARLPETLERALSRVIVTPRMHGIHHSVASDEVNSNWSSGLAVWDRLHGTFRLDVPQEAISIGVPAYREPGDVGIGRMLALPFVARNLNTPQRAERRAAQTAPTAPPDA